MSIVARKTDEFITNASGGNKRNPALTAALVEFMTRKERQII